MAEANNKYKYKYMHEKRKLSSGSFPKLWLQELLLQLHTSVLMCFTGSSSWLCTVVICVKSCVAVIKFIKEQTLLRLFLQIYLTFIDNLIF